MKRAMSFEMEVASQPCIRELDGDQEVLVLDSNNTLHMLSPEGQRCIEYGRAGIKDEAFYSTMRVPYLLPSIATGEETVFGLDDGRLFCIDRYGRTQWQFRARGPVTTPVVHNGHVFVGTHEGVLALKEGKRWWYKTCGPVLSIQLMELNNKMVLVAGSEDNHAYCLSLAGENLWRYKTKGMVQARPQKYKNMVSIGSMDGYVYTLTGKGELVQKKKVGPVICQTLANGSVITSSTTHTFANDMLLPYHSLSAPAIYGDSLIFCGQWAINFASLNAPGEKYRKILLDHNPSLTPNILKTRHKEYIVTVEEGKINLLHFVGTAE